MENIASNGLGKHVWRKRNDNITVGRESRGGGRKGGDRQKNRFMPTGLSREPCGKVCVALRQCPLDFSVRLKRQVFKVDIGGQVFGRRFYRLGGGGGRGGGGEPEGMEGEGRRARAGGGPEDVR